MTGWYSLIPISIYVKIFSDKHKHVIIKGGTKMFKITIICKDTGEKRIYEKSLFLCENLSLLQKQVTALGGEWQTLSNSIQISVPTDNCFHELTYSIEQFQTPSSITNDWIRITKSGQTQFIFKKTYTSLNKWEDIVIYARLYGGKVSKNSFDFEKDTSLVAFVKHFIREYICFKNSL